MEKRARNAGTYYEEFGRCEARQQTGPDGVTFERRYLHWQTQRNANATMFERETDSLYRPGTSVQTEKFIKTKSAWSQTNPNDLAKKSLKVSVYQLNGIIL